MKESTGITNNLAGSGRNGHSPGGNMLKKLQAMLARKDQQPVGERYILALEKHIVRLKGHRQRVRKPAPYFRAALVKRQKKARN